MSSSQFQHIFFICDTSLQSCLFKDFLEKSLRKNVEMLTFDKFVSGSYENKDQSIVIIDFTYITMKSISYIITTSPKMNLKPKRF